MERPVKLVYEPGAVRAASTFEIPAGTYEPVLETKAHVFYLARGIEIQKRWTQWKPKKDKQRSRPGGFALVKSAGTWWLFTLGDLEDLREDGMPELGLMFVDKIDGRVVNLCAQAGRSDESNGLVATARMWGILDDYSAIRLEGSAPSLVNEK